MKKILITAFIGSLFSINLFCQAVGIGTDNPLGKLNVHDPDNSKTQIFITPQTTGQGDSTLIFFAEDHNATFGMFWQYDGIGNRMELWGKNTSGLQGPHFKLNRDNGDATFEGKLNIGSAYTFPTIDGVNGQFLRTNGSGTLSWQNDAVNDADASPSNELQTLSISGDDLTISSGNSVDLGGFSGKWDEGSGSDIYYTGTVGIGTSTTPTSKLLIRQTGNEDAVFIDNAYSGSSSKRGLNIQLNPSGTGSKTGIYSQVAAGNSTSTTGINTYVVAGSTGSHYGLYASISGAGTAIKGRAIDASGVAAEMEGSTHLLGNVAIGTEEELGILHVHDESTSAKMYITPSNNTSGGSSSLFLGEDDDATYGMEWKYNGSSDNLELLGRGLIFNSPFTFGPHVYVSRASGNIAIGSPTMADDHKLSINGKVACEEVLVEMSEDWPDYVFKDDYKLRPIKELTEFIKEKGHLPGIAPAHKIEDEGLQLGKMQKILTEKIEELTLYIIELNKANDDLQLRVKELEESLD